MPDLGFGARFRGSGVLVGVLGIGGVGAPRVFGGGSGDVRTFCFFNDS